MFEKARSLLDGSHRSLLRVRRDAVPLPLVIGAVLRAMRGGGRSFVHRLMAYGHAQPSPLVPPGDERQQEYRRWLDAQPACTVPADAGMVSVVMPVCNTPERFLREAVASVQAQTYTNWELCLHDDASDQPHVHGLLQELGESIPGLRVSRSAQRGGIAAATNAALVQASGRWVALLDHDDLLHPDALAAVVACHVRTGAQIVYTDHDVLGDEGALRDPYFKPDWNLDLFLAQMYLGHLLSFERRAIDAAGGLRSDCDGSQDYDLVLRCIEAGAVVRHVPRVLYHWRAHAGSTACSADAKPYAHHAGKRAIQHYLDVCHPGARADDGPQLFCYDVRYPYADQLPLASIIIPTRDGHDLISTCIESLLATTVYPHYEIIVVDNGSTDPATLSWLGRISAHADIRVLRADVPFNWSALNNLAAREANGDVLVFLNNDTETIRGDWLQRLVENALRPGVGACGALLLYGDGTIQHAGVVVGMGGWADHVFKGEPATHRQHLFVSPVLQRQVLAVTGACMAIARRTFEGIGGFDETFVVCGSDVELCLRASRHGLATVYVANAVMVHHESRTRDPRAIPEGDFIRSAAAYSPYRQAGDPFYNPNLDYMASSPALAARCA